VIRLDQDQVIADRAAEEIGSKVYSRTTRIRNFRIKEGTLDVFPSYADAAFRIHFSAMG
jgi:hypothetical protein